MPEPMPEPITPLESVNLKWTPSVLSNTGCQYRFFPLFEKGRGVGPLAPLGDILWDCTDKFGERHNQIASVANLQDELLAYCKDRPKWKNVENASFVKSRFAIKKLASSSTIREIFGLELAIETTGRPNQYETTGLCIKTKSVPESQREAAPFPRVYHTIPEGESFDGMDSFTVGSTEHAISVEVKIGFRSKIVKETALGAHLVIDVGNSRTCALLLKDRADGILSNIQSFRSCCKPVLLGLDVKNNAVSKTDLSKVEEGIVSSWIVLHQTPFDDDENQILQKRYVQKSVKEGFLFKKTKTFNAFEEWRLPTMFMHCSPVVLGHEVEESLGDSDVKRYLIDRGLKIQQSSPKRYFASKVKTEKAWSMIPNVFSDEANLNANLLSSDLLRLMNDNGEYVDASKVDEIYRPLKNPTNPNYPRRASLIWMLVAILERAWDQCNRFVGEDEMYTPYRIEDVTITFPSGWTLDEVTHYKQVCKEAVQIFEKMMFFTDGEIKLLMNIDESVASQLPFVFSEINKYRDNAAGWMRFAGKKREDKNTVRVLNYDIGGGTADLSVVEYCCCEDDRAGAVSIQPRLLFKDGYCEAGDELLRQLLEKVILPGLEDTDARFRKKITRYFTGMPVNEGDCVTRSNFLRLCVIPLGIKLLTELMSGTASGKLSPANCGILRTKWEDFYRVFDLPDKNMNEWWSAAIVYDVNEVNALVREYFKNAFRTVSRVAEEYDADIFFMSGKTSELPALKELAREVLPLTNDRILTAKSYRPGDWYPFVKMNEKGVVEDNSILDAKSITAVGAALGFLLVQDRVRGWHLAEMVNATTARSEWGTHSEFMSPYGTPFLFGDDDKTKTRLMADEIIVRRMAAGASSAPVYKFRARTGESLRNLLEVVLTRHLDEGTNLESLSVDAVTENGRDRTKEFELVVCQEDECFWQDSGRVITD